MKDVTQVLIEAKALISNPKNWTTNYFAKDDEGFDCDPSKKAACQWCAMGAVYHIVGKFSYLEAKEEWKLLAAASDSLYRSTVVAVNDNLGHAPIMRVYDKAIELSRSSS